MDTYTKDHSKRLKFYEILQLLTQMKEADLLHSDPENKNNILVYRAVGKNGKPEGWYSENIFSVAQELMDNYKSQQALWHVLEEHNFEPCFEEPCFPVVTEMQSALEHEKRKADKETVKNTKKPDKNKFDIER